MRERKSPAAPQVSEEEEGRGAPCAGAEIPPQPTEKTVGKQVVPLQAGEDPTPQQMDVP